MKKWLPYVLAAVGVGVAIVAFGPDTAKAPKKEKAERAEKVRKTVEVRDFGADGVRLGDDPSTEGRTPAEVVAEAKTREIPPPGTLRPLNESEIAHQARLARPYNKRQAHVSSFWMRATQIVGAKDPALAEECAAISRYLREQGNLNEELDPAAAVQKELALVQKLRAVDPGNAELVGILDYIDATGNALLSGQDPLAVEKPVGASRAKR
jgi:hypothetical protein